MTTENWSVKITPGKKPGEQGTIRFKGFQAMLDLFKDRIGVNKFFNFEPDEQLEKKILAEYVAELIGKIRSGQMPDDSSLEDISGEQWKGLLDKEAATLKFS